MSLNQYASSVADAAAQLAAALNNENHKKVEMGFKIGGNFHLYAGGNVRIEGVGEKIDGKYDVETSTHTITGSDGMKSNIEAVGIRDPFYSWQVGGSIVYNQETASEAPSYESTYEQPARRQAQPM